MTFQGKLDKILYFNSSMSQLVLEDGVRINGELVKQYVWFLVKPEQAIKLFFLYSGVQLEVEAEGLGIVPKSLNVGWS